MREGASSKADIITSDELERQGDSSRLNLKLRLSAISTDDLARGAIYILQSLLGYTLMLAVMQVIPLPRTLSILITINRTFHAGYILSIVLALGVGEAVFQGRGGTSC